jgi:hypothetical protein
MTFEELEKALKEVTEKLTELAIRENSLSNKEWRLQQRLLKESGLLERIKNAKESNNKPEEVKLLTQYNMLKDAYGRNPVISYLMQLRMRSQIWK